MFPHTRLRRNRINPTLRDILRETRVTLDDLVQPIFIKSGLNEVTPISAMPGMNQITLDHLPAEIEELQSLGIKSVMLFGLPEYKDEQGLSSCAPDGIIQQAIKTIKALYPACLVIADLCLCQYTTHGHCGVLSDDPAELIDNDLSLEMLIKQGLSLAEAGVDMLAPSAMLDGTVTELRKHLDAAGFKNTTIMIHSAKYASSLYGPFREAAKGAPQFGNRRSYQMDIGNRLEASREVELDIQEGADIVMIKPAGMYLDVIHQIKTDFPSMPVAAYQVGGEYAMIKAASEKGWLNENAMILESLLAIKRAGADIIISYFTKAFARLS